jgi:hypothetical protein
MNKEVQNCFSSLERKPFLEESEGSVTSSPSVRSLVDHIVGKEDLLFSIEQEDEDSAMPREFIEGKELDFLSLNFQLNDVGIRDDIRNKMDQNFIMDNQKINSETNWNIYCRKLENRKAFPIVEDLVCDFAILTHQDQNDYLRSLKKKLKPKSLALFKNILKLPAYYGPLLPEKITILNKLTKREISCLNQTFIGAHNGHLSGQDIMTTAIILQNQEYNEIFKDAFLDDLWYHKGSKRIWSKPRINMKAIRPILDGISMQYTQEARYIFNSVDDQRKLSTVSLSQIKKCVNSVNIINTILDRTNQSFYIEFGAFYCKELADFVDFINKQKPLFLNKKKNRTKY